MSQWVVVVGRNGGGGGGAGGGGVGHCLHFGAVTRRQWKLHDDDQRGGERTKTGMSLGVRVCLAKTAVAKTGRWGGSLAVERLLQTVNYCPLQRTLSAVKNALNVTLSIRTYVLDLYSHNTTRVRNVFRACFRP